MKNLNEQKMKKIYYVYDEGDCEMYGETEGFFDEKGTLLQWWCCNDANWRSEYMDPLLEALGFNVIYPTKKIAQKFIKEIRKAYD